MNAPESTGKQGRPRASSRETLAEAACELFLERGYDATSVSDITARAGVSRSSFFNYFSSKHDVVWSGIDERIAVLETQLHEPGAGSRIAELLAGFATDLHPDAFALAFAQADTMGASADLVRESAVRASEVSTAIGGALQEAGLPPLQAAVLGSSYAGALMAALERWALEAPGRTALTDTVAEAIGYLEPLAGSAPDAS